MRLNLSMVTTVDAHFRVCFNSLYKLPAEITTIHVFKTREKSIEENTQNFNFSRKCPQTIIDDAYDVERYFSAPRKRFNDFGCIEMYFSIS